MVSSSDRTATAAAFTQVSLASKERLWNPLKLTETEWKHTLLEVGKMGELDLWVVIWAIRPLSVSLWALQNHFYAINQLQLLKKSLKSAQTPQGNLCCLCNFEHNIWCLPKLASHRRSLFQSKPSVWRLILRNPIKEALFKVLASPGEVMIPAMKSVGRTMGKTKSP